MALPKPVRILAAVTICLFLFLFLQLFRAEPGQLKMPESAPTGKKFQEWEHDPQLDRECWAILGTT
jgi:mannosyltransferase